MYKNPLNSQVSKEQTPCLSCDLLKKQKDTIGGVIISTKHFEARQDYAVPIPGFVILSTKRHVKSIDEFTREERHEFIDLLYEIRKNMRSALNIETAYLIQEEDASHFHLWLFPRYDWMNELGRKIKSVKPIMQWAQKNLQTPENLENIRDATEKLRKFLSNFSQSKNDICKKQSLSKVFI